MSSVSGISSSNYGVYSLYSKLDSTNKGYFDVSDLETALSALSSTSSTSSASSVSASEMFSQIDSDGDGKVTQDELSTSLKNLADELDSQFNQMRMGGGMPPPDGTSDTGFTKDELTSQLSEIGSSDSARSSLISSVIDNFDAADTNSDGKVSNSEAMAYADTAGISATTTTSNTASSASGFTADELTSQLSDIGSTDSARSTLISSIVQNFDAADTNSDGKVSNSEAMAYAETNNISSSASTNSDSNSNVSDAQIFRQLMELMNSYGSSDSNNLFMSVLSSTISTTA